MGLLSNSKTNPKTAKLLEQMSIEGVILHLTPDKLADGHHTVCAWSTAGCRSMCLNTAGRSQVTGVLSTEKLSMYMIHRARIGKTLKWLSQREMFIRELKRELFLLESRAARKGFAAVARLNGTSDIPWEHSIDMEKFDIQFYDYTKSYSRMRKFLTGRMPKNYHITLSRSEITPKGQITSTCSHGGNVAVVFRDKLPRTYLNIKVINGDEHDFRFKDRKGVIVGLKAKGRAKHDTTGFVV